MEKGDHGSHAVTEQLIYEAAVEIHPRLVESIAVNLAHFLAQPKHGNQWRMSEIVAE